MEKKADDRGHIIAMVTLTIPVSLTFDKGTDLSPEQIRFWAVENLFSHPALKSPAALGIYVDGVRVIGEEDIERDRRAPGTLPDDDDDEEVEKDWDDCPHGKRTGYCSIC